MLDGGQRLPTFMTDTGALARIEPLIADGLLSSHPVREPGQTFSLFTWLNNGGVVMDWLISSIEEVDADADRIPTGVLSVADMANWLKLSRTHLARKLRAAERTGQPWLARQTRPFRDVGLEGLLAGIRTRPGRQARRHRCCVPGRLSRAR